MAPVRISDAEDLWRVIDTSRGHLRQWLEWPDLITSFSQARWMGGHCEDDWHRCSDFRFAIRNRVDGSLLGLIGFESCDFHNRICNMGYWLSQNVQGCGLLSEAAYVALNHIADNALRLQRINLYISIKNRRSLAVAHRLGFHHELGVDEPPANSVYFDHLLFSKNLLQFAYPNLDMKKSTSSNSKEL